MISFDDNINLPKHGHFLGQTVNSTLRDTIKGRYDKEFYGRPLRLSNQELDWFSKAPKDSWLPYLEYRYKFKTYPKEKIVAPFPIYLLIEPTSVCNIRCVMCYQIDPSFTKDTIQGFMNFDLFKSVIDQAKEGGTQAITLASRGEPTLHPKLIGMLEYLKRKFLDLKINTNAIRLTKELCQAIIESEVNEVVFSVDASTKETYEKIRVGGKFDQVVNNIELFNKVRSRYPKNRTVTRISGVKVLPSEQNEQAMVEFWSKLVDQVTIKDAVARWDTYNNKPTHLTDPCYFLWERMYVWFDGTVNPCDVDYNSKLKVGNVALDSIKNIWNGEKYTKLREFHKLGRRNELMPCDRCEIC